MGNSYIYNINHYVKHHEQDLKLPLHLNRAERQARHAITRTSTHRAQNWLLLWFVTVTREVTKLESTRGSQMAWYLILQIFGQYMLYLGLRTEISGDLRLFRPRLRHIVPDDSPFLEACRQGDIYMIRTLLATKRASCREVTRDNLSPLFFAIQGGNEHVVRELLTHGADVDETFGENQTLPLSWALHKRNEEMIRMLVDSGSCLQHISRLGWSLMYYLWIDESKVQPSCLQLLRLLQTADPILFRQSYQDLVDREGFSIMNRVACMGTPDEIEFLIGNGADLYSKTDWDWNPLFHAVFDGRYGNLQKLIPYYSDWPEHRDMRGWTLLHLAAAEGHDSIVRYLLRLGADWQAKSWPSCTWVNEELRGVRCTPAQVARSESVEKEEQFLKAVKETCGVECITSGEKHEEQQQHAIKGD